MPAERKLKYHDFGRVVADANIKTTDLINKLLEQIGETEDTQVYSYFDEHNNELVMNVYGYILETQEEADAREAQEARWKEENEERQKKHYQVLKLIYEENVNPEEAHERIHGVRLPMWANGDIPQPIA